MSVQFRHAAVQASWSSALLIRVVHIRDCMIAMRDAFLYCAGERRSRRARKNRQPVKACSTDTLAMLKLKVFEVLSVHPANQRLYVRGQLVEGEDFTLARVSVRLLSWC